MATHMGPDGCHDTSIKADDFRLDVPDQRECCRICNRAYDDTDTQVFRFRDLERGSICSACYFDQCV